MVLAHVPEHQTALVVKEGLARVIVEVDNIRHFRQLRIGVNRNIPCLQSEMVHCRQGIFLRLLHRLKIMKNFNLKFP